MLDYLDTKEIYFFTNLSYRLRVGERHHCGEDFGMTPGGDFWGDLCVEDLE